MNNYFGKEVDIYKYQIFMIRYAMKEETKKPKYPIREAAKILNISVHTLRMYEKEGLILPYQKQTGHRLYSDFDIERIKCIRSAINEKKISINGIKSLFSLIPCWEIVSCNINDRDNCESYKSAERPCWTYEHTNNICSTLDCIKCEVYTSFHYCSNIKTAIKNLNSYVNKYTNKFMEAV